MVTIQDNSDIIEIIDAYSKEYAEDSMIDEYRLREMLLKIAGIKGKWVTYKAINKAKLYKLKQKRDNLIEEAVPAIQQKREDEGHNVTKRGAEMILRSTKKFKDLDNSITKLTILSEYLEDSVKCIQFINNDIKNLIDTIKVDEM